MKTEREKEDEEEVLPREGDSYYHLNSVPGRCLGAGNKSRAGRGLPGGTGEDRPGEVRPHDIRYRPCIGSVSLRRDWGLCRTPNSPTLPTFAGVGKN